MHDWGVINDAGSSDVYFPVGNYFVSILNKNFSILNPDFYKIRIMLSSKNGKKYTTVTIKHGEDIIFEERFIGRGNISIKRV